MRIRPALPSDLTAAVDVWRAAWLDGHRGHVPPALLAARDRADFVDRATALIDSTLLATDAGDRVLGLVIVTADELVQLAVAGVARNLGVGATLLEAAEARIALVADEAWLAVVPGNTRARAFYERRGWRDAGPMTYVAKTTAGTVDVPVRRYVKSLTAEGHSG